jgi:Flp pilus assembly protein TadG
LVETAIVLPVIMLLLFGVIEYSSAYNDSSVVADATRQGGRVASTLGGQLSASGTTPVNQQVTDTVASALKALPADAPKTLWIYEANNNGFPLPSTQTSMGTCSTNCFRYTWNSTSKSWTYVAGSWAVSAQQVCTPPLDQVGIWVKIDHAFVTGLFGATLNLDDHAVFRFEPSPSC